MKNKSDFSNQMFVVRLTGGRVGAGELVVEVQRQGLLLLCIALPHVRRRTQRSGQHF